MTKLSLPSILLLLAGPLVSCDSAASGDGPGGGAAAPTKASRFRFTYAVTVPAPPAGTRELKIWVPLPHQDPGVQTVANLDVRTEGPHEVTADPDYGNRMVHVRLENPSGPTRISWAADITRHPDAGQGAGPMNPRFLQPNARIRLEGPATELARTLGVLDDSRDRAARARAIYDDVLNNMAYDKSGTGWGQGDFQHAVKVCKGNCTDFHARFIGIGRAAKIPVRFTMGIPLKAGRNSYNSYHCWAHWHDGGHWRPVDISEADKVADRDPGRADGYFGHLDPDRIGLTTGRDITLNPPQAGAKLNYLVFPYAEADGRPLPLDKSMWQFSWKFL